MLRNTLPVNSRGAVLFSVRISATYAMNALKVLYIHFCLILHIFGLILHICISRKREGGKKIQWWKRHHSHVMFPSSWYIAVSAKFAKSVDALCFQKLGCGVKLPKYSLVRRYLQKTATQPLKCSLVISIHYRNDKSLVLTTLQITT